LKLAVFRAFQISVTLTLNWVIQHTLMYHSSTSIYIPNFVHIGKNFVDGPRPMYGRTLSRFVTTTPSDGFFSINWI